MTSALRWRDGSGVHHSAAAEVVALPADVCVVRLTVRAAGGSGRRESRRQAAMKRFMPCGAHGKAMRKLAEWCDEAAVVHWTQESAEPPTWPEAYQRLHKDGRRSKVNHPSAGHLAYEFPAPQVNPRGELAFK